MSNHATASLGSSAPLPASGVDPLVLQRTVFNDDRSHRYTLFRHWGNPDDYACGISMNPSGATEDASDPTVDRMVRRAQELWCVGAYYQLNVMSIRGTYSSELANAVQTNLPKNDDWIRTIAAKAKLVVVSWGNAGTTSGRGPIVEKILLEVCDPERVFCFRKNKNGSPAHPIRQPHTAKLIPYFTRPIEFNPK